MTPEITDMFGTHVPIAEHKRKAAKRAHSEVTGRLKRSEPIDPFWNEHLNAAFLRGANTSMTHRGADVATMAGQGVERYSAWAWDDDVMALLESGFRKSRNLSAEALVDKMRNTALNTAARRGIPREDMLDYTAAAVLIMVQARKMIDSTRDALLNRVYQGSLF